MTDKQPTKEQIKKLWEWCGIYEDLDGWWIYPDGIKRRHKPPLDLNNLFKCAVPMTQKMGLELRLYGGEEGENFHAMFRALFSCLVGCTQSKDPALALLWAIWKVAELK